MENEKNDQQKQQKQGQSNSRRSSRRRRGRRGNRSRSPRAPRIVMNCAICGKPIKYIYTAIEHGSERGPVHFDCKLKELNEQEELQNNEKICYIGKGTFAVVKYHHGAGKRFTIKKRIDVEEQNVAADWRRELGKAIRR